MGQLHSLQPRGELQIWGEAREVFALHSGLATTSIVERGCWLGHGAGELWRVACILLQ